MDGFSGLGFAFQKRTELKIPVFHISGKRVLVTLGGHGKVQFGIQTQYLLSHLKDISGVICVGAGGGLAGHLEVGDLVVAEKTIEHDYNEKFVLNAKLPEFQAHPDLIEKFKNLSLTKSFAIHFGAVASGDEDIVEVGRANELFARTGALAVAWEGTGGAKACKFNDIPFLEIRAITDKARESVAESFSANLSACMKNAAELLCHAVEES